jgi:hypothetical protein
MYIFGGNDLTDTFGDFWKIDLKPLVQSYRAASLPSSSMPLHPLESTTEWIHIQGWSPDYPSERIGHTMTPIGSNYFVLYGGRNYLGGTMADGLSLSVSLDLSLARSLPVSLSLSADLSLSGVFLYDVEKSHWHDITPSDYDSTILNRTGHCCIPTSHGLMFFGGLTGEQSVSSEIILLDLFSVFDVRYNSEKDTYEYVAPPGTAASHTSASLRAIVSQWFSFVDYRPIEFHGP